jgi:DNA invertase Pin-like site-specific DNA recombinase
MRGVEVLEWFEDLDQSGGKLERPGLSALLARIENGETGGVIVARLDRLSRLGVADALKLVERITDAGGTIAAIDQGIDPTTVMGKFAQTLFLAMAQMERERIAESWQTAQERAIQRGVPASRAPYGYRKAADGRLEPDPAEGLHIRKAFELAASSGIAPATRYLEQNVPERTWTTSHVRAILGSRTYLGEVRSKTVVNAEAHHPLVTRAIWQAAQQDKARVYSRSGKYPLSGIARCGTCGSSMIGGSRGSYICRASQTHRKRTGATTCQYPASIAAHRLEGYLFTVLRNQWASDDWQISRNPAENVSEAQKALEEAEEELFAFASDLQLRKALGSRYHEALALRESAVKEAQTAFQAQAEESSMFESISPEGLETDNPAQLRDVFNAVFDVIEVKRGRGRVEDRVHYLFRGSWLGRQVERNLTNVLNR